MRWQNEVTGALISDFRMMRKWLLNIIFQPLLKLNSAIMLEHFSAKRTVASFAVELLIRTSKCVLMDLRWRVLVVAAFCRTLDYTKRALEEFMMVDLINL